MRPVFLFRNTRELDGGELPEITSRFLTIDSRVKAQTHDLVIARYSALPFYKELEYDLSLHGAKLVNSWHEHRWVADLSNWVDALGELTPKTWSKLELVPDEEFPIVVKGETNSKKFHWNTHMFAKDRAEAILVMCRLMDDGLISSQNLYFRKYVPLVKLYDGFNGLPISKEFRIFVYDGRILSKGFYWSNHDDVVKIPDVDEIPQEFLDDVIKRVDGRVKYYTVDVAQTESGEWIVIELNDGQMSGLQLNDPSVLYENLRKVLSNAANVQTA